MQNFQKSQFLTPKNHQEYLKYQEITIKFGWSKRAIFENQKVLKDHTYKHKLFLEYNVIYFEIIKSFEFKCNEYLQYRTRNIHFKM